MENDNLRSLAGERMVDDSLSDQLRRSPWERAMQNADLCPEGSELVMTFQDDNRTKYEVPIDEVEAMVLSGIAMVRKRSKHD